ncbi:DUF6093 family protein [Oerskovia paurometabola]|uniref:DUF6093 family protein n=1 Tax=Oerskovia paurometabola TaxID=162170 RepID=UPI0034404BB8
MPFDSTRVVHPDWAAHHALVAEGTMNATCTVSSTTSDESGWDPSNGPTAPGGTTTTYTGRCRLTYLENQPDEGDAAGQATTVRAVLVALPRAADQQPAGARVTITAVDMNGPAALTGRVLTVRSTEYSSHALEQYLTCTDDQTNQPPGGP